MRSLRVSVLILLAAVLCLALFACVKDTPPAGENGGAPGGDTEQTAYFYNGTAQHTLALAGQGTITLPSAPQMAGAQFVGWCLEGESPRLYRAGERFDAIPAAGDLTFRAVGISLSTAVGAVLDATAEALCFQGKLGGEGYRTLAALVGVENLTAGILIAPYIEVTGGNRRFTVDCGAEGLLVRTSTPLPEGAASYYLLTGTGEPIADADLLEKYAARAYLAVTFGGQTDYFYAEYLPLEHTCSRYGAAAFLYEDLTLAPDETHTVAVHTPLGERYSPCSEEMREVLRALLDRVVNVDTVTGRAVNRYSRNNVDFYDFAYYTTPYYVAQVLSDTPNGFDSFVVRGEGVDLANIAGYFVGGSYRPVQGDELREDGYYIAVSNQTA